MASENNAIRSTASSTPPPSLTDVISSYAILPTLASWISTVDLYHLALTNRSHYSHILASETIFKTLRRQSLCDGRGLADRQALRNLNPHFDYIWGRGRKIHRDEEIEVRLYNLKCDEAGALPCVRCGINVCEECRYCPRVPPENNYPVRRPHLNGPLQLQGIVCLCLECDAKTEADVSGKFLNELCDCDLFERWVCRGCNHAEREAGSEYLEKHTKFEWHPEDGEKPTKTMRDHAFVRAVWCVCGMEVPQETRPRCILCKRSHLPDGAWDDEWERVGSKMPYFDNDPCYPRWVTDRDGNYPKPYPELEYDRIRQSRPSRSHEEN
ncbi:hypothetical protein B0T10DRAFT_407001 [Thelonectria olida]|uniref:Uncharacterized protein n=1 Tax=Thelonectria olida TaxID=1576542 RepID=A0A9P8W3W9_9HYPO|nr:hypothetical protein B0T10DRAFT_407001 [Thelonectria olida]